MLTSSGVRGLECATPSLHPPGCCQLLHDLSAPALRPRVTEGLGRGVRTHCELWKSIATRMWYSRAGPPLCSPWGWFSEGSGGQEVGWRQSVSLQPTKPRVRGAFATNPLCSPIARVLNLTGLGGLTPRFAYIGLGQCFVKHRFDTTSTNTTPCNEDEENARPEGKKQKKAGV